MPDYHCLECSTRFHSAYLPKGERKEAALCPKCEFADENAREEYEAGHDVLRALFQRPSDVEPVHPRVMKALFGDHCEA